MRDINFNVINSNDLPAWYRAENYDYCDSMYTVTFKKVQFSLFNKFIKSFL